LASTGATQQAKSLFAEFNLDHHQDVRLSSPLGLDIAALGARLLKDEALAAAGPVRTLMLKAAGDAYASLYRRSAAASNPDAYYPGVNAATLWVLAGQNEAAMALAGEVLDQLASRPADQKSYYEIASELEAQLVLGDLDAAHKNVLTVRAAIRQAPEHDYRG